MACFLSLLEAWSSLSVSPSLRLSGSLPPSSIPSFFLFSFYLTFSLLFFSFLFFFAPVDSDQENRRSGGEWRIAAKKQI